MFVASRGVYSTLPGVDVWDAARDARTYRGPFPVVAHPPCARWSVLAKSVEARYGIPAHRDDGEFRAALEAVRQWGGVLEHPAYSAAWRAHGLRGPVPGGGWTAADWDGGWTCELEQVTYGHVCRKRTWLYAHGLSLERVPIRWSLGSSGSRTVTRGPRCVVDGLAGGHSARTATPIRFARLLLRLARTARPVEKL